MSRSYRRVAPPAEPQPVRKFMSRPETKQETHQRCRRRVRYLLKVGRLLEHLHALPG